MVSRVLFQTEKTDEWPRRLPLFDHPFRSGQSNITCWLMYLPKALPGALLGCSQQRPGFTCPLPSPSRVFIRTVGLIRGNVEIHHSAALLLLPRFSVSAESLLKGSFGAVAEGGEATPVFSLTVSPNTTS